MKAKNYLSISIRFSADILSIKLAAAKLVTILVSLGRIDPVFLNPVMIIGNKSELPINLNQNNKEELVVQFAKGILRAEWNEITQHEGNHTPTIDYTRIGGYPILLKFKKEENILFWMGCRLGSNLYQTVNIRDFSEYHLFEYSWYEMIFKNLVVITKAEIGTVAISNESFGKFYNQFKIQYPIGWITYFSSNSEYEIPDDIQDVRYNHVETGKYIYTSDEDFMKDKEAYFGNREKLGKIITEFKQRLPEFSKP